MRSVIQKRSYNSVKVFWLNIDNIIYNIRKSVKSLTRKHPDIIKVVLLGSVAEGRAVPSSDADILIILKESKTRQLDRSLEFIDSFNDAGITVDLFVYTIDEIYAGKIPIAKKAIEKGIALFENN